MTTDGLWSALSEITAEPLRRFFDVGVNVIASEQLADGARLCPVAQVVPGAFAKLPLIVIPDSVSGVVPEFDRVTICAALVVPTFCFPKIRLFVLKRSTGLITVAMIETVCGLPAALSLTTSVAA